MIHRMIILWSFHARSRPPPPFQVSWHVITWRFLMVFEGLWRSLKAFEGFWCFFSRFLMVFWRFWWFVERFWWFFSRFLMLYFFVWGFSRCLMVFEGFWKFLMGYSNQSKNALHFEHKYSIYPSKPYSNYLFSTSSGDSVIFQLLFFFFLIWPTPNIIPTKNPHPPKNILSTLGSLYTCIYIYTCDITSTIYMYLYMCYFIFLLYIIQDIIYIWHTIHMFNVRAADLQRPPLLFSSQKKRGTPANRNNLLKYIQMEVSIVMGVPQVMDGLKGKIPI